MSACSQVFGITELLETILRVSSASTIVRCRAVSRSWKITIEDSIILRREIFLETINTAPDIHQNSNNKDTQQVLLNTLLFKPDDGEVNWDKFLAHPYGLSGQVFEFHAHLRHVLFVRHAAPTSLFHGMFLTQPPVSSIRLCSRTTLFPISMGFKNIQGVKFGDVLRKIREKRLKNCWVFLECEMDISVPVER